MSEDGKPGLRLGPVVRDAVQNAKAQGAEVDIAVQQVLFNEAGIGRLARFDRDESVYDEGGFDPADPSGFDDGF